MNEAMWMVRAGEGAYLIEAFEKGYVAIGWNDIGDLSKIKDQKQMPTSGFFVSSNTLFLLSSG